MRAIVIEQYGGPENLVLREIPDPEPVSGQVVIEVKAFDLNHCGEPFSERCLGRSRESHRDRMRGRRQGRSGRAFFHRAKGRSADGRDGTSLQRKLCAIHASLEALGAHTPMLEAPDLSVQVRRMHPMGVDGVLDLIGNSAVLDSLAAVRPDGRVCLAGESFDPLRRMPSGVHLSFFASAFTFGNPEYPLSGIPFQTIVDRAEANVYGAKPARVFRFEEIQEAHRLMESGQANGKIVVSLS